MTCPNNVCGTGIVPGPKPGDPDNNIALTANVAYGGIDVKWTYPTSNAHAVAHTLLYRGTTNNRDAAIQIAVVAGNLFYDKIAEVGTYFYWIQVVSVNGTVGDFIGPASATTRARSQDIVEDITGQIDRGVLGTALRQDIARIALNYDELTDEIRNRISEAAALSGAFADLEAGLVEAVSLVHTEITTRQDGDNAFAQQMTIIAAANAANASAIIDESTARVNSDEASSRRYQAVLAATEGNAAAIVDERIARTTADSSVAQRISTTQSTLGNQIASVQVGAQTQIDATNGRVNQIGALWTAKVSVNGLVGGFGVYNNGEFVEAGFDVDRFWIGRTQANKRKPFIIENGITYIDSAVIRDGSIDNAKIGNAAIRTANIGVAEIDTLRIAGNAVSIALWGSGFKSAQVSFTVPPGEVWESVTTVNYSGNASYGDGNSYVPTKGVYSLSGLGGLTVPFSFYSNYQVNTESGGGYPIFIQVPVTRSVTRSHGPGFHTIDASYYLTWNRPGVGTESLVTINTLVKKR